MNHKLNIMKHLLNIMKHSPFDATISALDAATSMLDVAILALSAKFTAISVIAGVQKIPISQGLVTVTHLSYTNTAIAGDATPGADVATSNIECLSVS